MIGCSRANFAMLAAFALLLSPLAFADSPPNASVCSYSNSDSKALLLFDKGFVAGSSRYSGGCFTVTVCPANATAAVVAPAVAAAPACPNATQKPAAASSCIVANQANASCVMGYGCDLSGQHNCCNGKTCMSGICYDTNASKGCHGFLDGCTNGDGMPCCGGLACIAGYCHSAGQCVESDNGNDPYMAGSISGELSGSGNGYGPTFILKSDDSCINSTTLQEYYCGSGKAQIAGVNCEYGCANGKCNAKNAPEGCQPVGSACKKTNAAGDTDCCKGLSCTGGYCQLQNASLKSCTETDGGNDPLNFGYVSPKPGTTDADYCLNGTTLREYYCKNGKESYNDTLCQFGCAALGHCRKAADAPCYDSDGGVDLGVKGTTIGYNPLTGETNVTDYCEGEHYLREYWCEGGFIASDTFNAYYCYNGKKYASSEDMLADMPIPIVNKNVTLPSIPIIALPSCSDSDGGKNFTVKGTVQASDGKNYTDSCARDGTVLTEYFCNGDGSAGRMSATCGGRGGGCIDGKCKS